MTVSTNKRPGWWRGFFVPVSRPTISGVGVVDWVLPTHGPPDLPFQFLTQDHKDPFSSQVWMEVLHGVETALLLL